MFCFRFLGFRAHQRHMQLKRFVFVDQFLFPMEFLDFPFVEVGLLSDHRWATFSLVIGTNNVIIQSFSYVAEYWG